jgi:hypothetical protein
LIAAPGRRVVAPLFGRAYSHVMLVRIIITAVFGGFGLVLLYVGVTQYFLQRRLLSNATTVDAEIVESHVQSSTSSGVGSTGALRRSSTTTHLPVVKFRYLVKGETYESELLRPTIIVRSYASRDTAAAALEPYPVGAKVRAHVDPATPDKAFLVAEASGAPVVYIVLGVLLPPVAWFASLLV